MRWTFTRLFALGLLFAAARADEFAWFDACADGDAATIREIVSNGVDPNYPDENGATPLILAARGGHLEAAEALLDGGADIELAADYPAQVDTPLSAASQEGHLPMVDFLLARGAVLDGKGRDGRTALMTAATRGRADVVEALLGRGAAVDAIKLDGTSALFWAAQEGHGEVGSP